MDITAQPEAQQTNPQLLMVSGGTRTWTFQPVLFVSGGRWRFGVVQEWISLPGKPWIARIAYGPQSDPFHYQFYDYLGDGAIVPLRLDAGGTELALRPVDPLPGVRLGTPV